MRVTQVSLIGLVALACAACTTSSSGGNATSLPPFQYYVDPTEGRVGYHFTGGVRVMRETIPGGAEQCVGGWHSGVLTGALPPRMTYNELAPPGQTFSGTPRQPGTWRVSLSVIAKCTAGPDQTEYPRTISATFNIVP